MALSNFMRMRSGASRFVLGFYDSIEHADEALREVRKDRFRRSAAVHRSEDGRLRIQYGGFSPYTRAIVSAVLALVIVLLGEALQPSGWVQILLASGAFLFGWLGQIWLGLGLRTTTLLRHGRFVLPGESLVVVLEAEERITEVIAVLRRIAYPSVFAIRPDLRFTPARDSNETLREPVTMAGLPGRAVELAESHRVDASTRCRSLLTIVRECENAIERARADLGEAARLDYGIDHAAEWLLDNTYLVRSHIAEIRHNLPDNHNKILPLVGDSKSPVRFRIYHIAAELIQCTAYRVTPDSMVSFLNAYQQRAPLTIAELWVLPLMLRLVLLQKLQRLSEQASLRQRQKEMSDLWANRLLNAASRGTGRFDEIVAQLDQGGAELTPHFISRLSEQLHKEESVLAPIQKWIEAKTGFRLADIHLREHADEANDLMFIATAIGSLRQLSELQYPKIVEAVSRMEAILREEPSGIHARSDFATRDRSRRIVEATARHSKKEEWNVARLAVELAQGAAPDRPEGCVAFYLLDKGLSKLEARAGTRVPWRERRLRFLHRHPTLIYLGGFGTLTTVIVGAFLFAASVMGVSSPLMFLLLGILALFPASDLALYLIQMWLTWFVPPTTLPKMSFDPGIPDECRTLVVVPMMLLTPDSVRGEIEKLEVRYLANSAPNVYFSLLADFTDAEAPQMPEDDNLVELAVAGIEQLNTRYGPGTFSLFHRSRVWCETERRWIGWERKRGKLEELNRFLNGEDCGDFVRAGIAPAAIRYVITLDADTQLPHGSARRLIETIAHPLNRVEFNGERRVRGYTIIQPRVSITLPSATATRFTRLFTDARGSDPYCQAVSDLYQDVFGEAIYHGKGIYDVQAFHKILTRRFPEQRLLSHDLIEGAYVGVGLATDVELFEQFPYDYTSYSKREHRWIRGDWQIVSWVFRKVPSGAGPGPVANPLTIINRWKIFDNLRRSLLAPCALLFLICSWAFNAAAMAASTLVALVLLVPLLFQLLRRWAQRWRGDVRALNEASSDLNRAIVMAAFMPHRAYLALDAIVRACYRLTVSKSHLLEWQTAEMSHLAASANVDAFRAQFFFISALAAVFMIVMEIRGFYWDFAWSPFLILWVAAPAVQYWIGWQRRAVRKLERIGVEDQRYLRRIARETWRYFDDLVGPDHNWLPPDNSQEALRIETAARTSPTNVGMWLMSAVSARDLGYLTPEQMIDRCSSTMDTLDKLERCEGHILNWYNTRTLEPLQPHYVSTVDSGNLIASLWVLEQACQELESQPQLGAQALRGLADTLSVLMDRFSPDHATAVPMETLRGLFQEGSSGIEIMDRIRLAAEPARKLTESLRWSITETEERAYWFVRMEEHVQAWIQYFDRYLRWADLLLAPPDEFLRPLGEKAILERRNLLRNLPDWGDLAAGAANILPEIFREGSRQGLPAHLRVWMADLKSEIENVSAASNDLLGRAARLAQRSEDLAAGMDMQFLYDAERRLFAIGYQVGGPLSFSAHYDLLASEARLTSLVAIAKGDVPVHHWLALGRPYTTLNGQVLLSWSGTMFEYLMPLLFTSSFRNSLLENACSTAVQCQMEYAREWGIPWGISESAYSGLDINKIYQYQAFGVPSLGLKRGLEDDLVVAPYATVLALSVEPEEAIRNLRRLEETGMYGRMGFYESLDYTRQQERQGGKGVIVYTYMAHHQGMSLTAIDNALNNGIMRQRFHGDQRIKAVEPLLFERIPPQPSMLVHRRSDHVAMRPLSEPSAPPYRVLDEDTRVPRVHLLGNSRYALMITNSGSGYSRWRNVDITRWRADSTRDNWGTFFYLRDEDSNTVWSATHQPLHAKDPAYTAIFSADRAEFRRRKRGIESHVEVTVSPEDDVEIRRITLTNRGLFERNLELISAAELCLAPHDTDRAHPAFNKLFIQTEARPDLQALLAWRRLRSPDDQPVWVAQFVVENPPVAGVFEYETDRTIFLGRGRSWQNPAMAAAGTAGYVLDPVFAIKRRFTLEPRQPQQISFITVAAESRDDLLRLIAKYRDSDIANRTFELAWSHAQVEYRYLDIQGDAAFRFDELASHLLYPNVRLRAPVERLRRNALGQSRLWAYGISGDLPLAVVSVPDSQGMALAREVLIAHTYWRLRGLKVDLVILNREPASYEQPLHHQLTRLVEAHSLHTGTNQPGGVFLRKVDQIPEEDLNLILTVAQVTLGGIRGPLSKQLVTAAEGLPLPGPLQIRPAEEQPSPSLPFLELPYFNGLGGFTPDGREYAIYLGPNTHTPVPWINVIANPSFGCMISESGSGCCWYGNSHSNRLTPWNNDPISDPCSEAIYIRDEDSGTFWSPTPSPVRELDAYRARHGQGYTEFEHNSHALEQTLLTFVPAQIDGEDPIRIQRLQIRNRSSRVRRLSVTAYSELVLGTDRENTQMHVACVWDESAKALFAHNRYHRDYGSRVTFAALAPDAVSHTSDRTEFLGRNGSPDSPAALRRISLSNRTGAGLDPCAALQTKFVLGPGQEKTVIVMLGQANDSGHARNLIARYRTPAAVEQAYVESRARWDRLLTTIQVQTPVLSVDLMMNRWLLYQSLSCRIWGRSALYQSSGAYGFRDQLQDSLAVVYAAPEIARELILGAAARQFVEGDVQHWWHLPSGEGVRTRCSDDLLWLPYVVYQYVQITGDSSLLDVPVHFLDGPELKDGELEAYFTPSISIEHATVFEHCRRAIEKGSTRGPHGLPLIGTGDWNDGMSGVGIEGKGESVWLAWFLIDVFKGFSDLCDRLGEDRLAGGYRESARSLSETVENTSWDGEWYRRGYFDDGTALGSRESEEARIDSLPQSWSVISGAGDPERSRSAMRKVEEYLIDRKEKIVLLFTPPFDKSKPHPGYIMGYPPGVRENGGQYTHAALWVAMALARMGEGRRAVEVLQMVNPIEHMHTAADQARYRTEPYAVAADVYSLKSQPGRGGWTWYTGSAGWMYRVWLEEVLGFKLRGDHLSIEPAIPEEWPGYVLTFRYGETEYRIEVQNGGTPSPTEIQLEDDRESHVIRVFTGRPPLRKAPGAPSAPSVVVN